MNYLTFINHMTRNIYHGNINYLVSGKDNLVKRTVINDIVSKLYGNLIIVDDSGNNIEYLGSETEDGMAYRLYNPFYMQSVYDISKLREIFHILEYDESKKAKLLAYINFIKNVESLSGQQFSLDMQVLMEYSTVMTVESQLRKLVYKGKINQQQQFSLLARYDECSSAGADLEDMFSILGPFVNGSKFIGRDSNKMILFPLYKFKNDITMKKLLLQLLQFTLEDYPDTPLIILDKGYGKREYFDSLVSNYQNIHILSDDIFTLNKDSLNIMMNTFSAKIYCRHENETSASVAEKQCGTIDVVKKQKTVSYDRRIKTRPLDILFGRDKIEGYTTLPAVRESKYYKESIMRFPEGTGIIEFNGQTSIFSIRGGV